MKKMIDWLWGKISGFAENDNPQGKHPDEALFDQIRELLVQITPELPEGLRESLTAKLIEAVNEYFEDVHGSISLMDALEAALFTETELSPDQQEEILGNITALVSKTVAALIEAEKRDPSG